MAVEYSNIIPIRFTNAQLAQVDEIAAQFKIKRSTLIREQLLSALSESTEKALSSRLSNYWGLYASLSNRQDFATSPDQGVVVATSFKVLFRLIHSLNSLKSQRHPASTG